MAGQCRHAKNQEKSTLYFNVNVHINQLTNVMSQMDQYQAKTGTEMLGYQFGKYGTGIAQ